MALRIAQYSTKHAHHVAVARAMRDCPLMTFVGVWEPDLARRQEVLDEADSPYAGLTWFGSLEEMLGDESIEAVACEGTNDESLDQAEQIVAAGKHLWLDKPAGENWAQWAAVVASAQAQQLHIQLGFMLRYHPAFIQLADWARSGFLGSVFKVLPGPRHPTPTLPQPLDFTQLHSRCGATCPSQPSTATRRATWTIHTPAVSSSTSEATWSSKSDSFPFFPTTRAVAASR